jgi:RNA polymerase sigma factor (TIGR02999 family)
MENGVDLTLLLHRVSGGETGAFDEAVAATYIQLEAVARRHLNLAYGARADDCTLEPSALVNEAFFRLRDQRSAFKDRSHYFAIASRVILRALRDYERKRNAGKRGGDHFRVTLSGLSADTPTLTSAIDLTDALEELEKLDERKAAVVRLRTLWGQTVAEIAETLSVSVPTVERDWRFARIWLHRKLTGVS